MIETMRVIVQYRGGHVPEADTAANEQALWAWLDRLRGQREHEQTVVLGGGRTLTGQGSGDYDGEVFGISVLRVPSVEAAAEMLADWPELLYGGHLDILAESAR